MSLKWKDLTPPEFPDSVQDPLAWKRLRARWIDWGATVSDFLNRWFRRGRDTNGDLQHSALSGLTAPADDHTQYMKKATNTVADGNFALWDGTSQRLIKDGGSQIGTTQITNNSVTYAKLQKVAATSVVANATGASSNAADLTYTTDGDVVLRRSGALVRQAFPIVETLEFQVSSAPAANTGVRGVLNASGDAASNAILKVPAGKTLKVLSARGCIKTGATVGTYKVYACLRNTTDGTYVNLATATGTAATVLYPDAVGTMDSPLGTLVAGKEYCLAYFNDATSPGALDATHRHHVLVSYFIE